jgi:hypothetical protein
VRYSCWRVLADPTLLAAMAGWTGQGHTARETNEMLYSRTPSASTADARQVPIPRPTSPAPADEAASTEVLITEHEVLFSTAAAMPARRESISRRFVASLRRIFSVSAQSSRPQRGDYPNRYEFLERALMAREMDTIS